MGPNDSMRRFMTSRCLTLLLRPHILSRSFAMRPNGLYDSPCRRRADMKFVKVQDEERPGEVARGITAPVF
jgi:hypothetical protein